MSEGEVGKALQEVAAKAKAKTQLTVAELIVKLSHMPPDLPVELEGCDCTGPAGGVETYASGWKSTTPDKVLITRETNE